MFTRHVVRAVAVAEMLIGASTITSLAVTSILDAQYKSLNVLIFVLLSAGLSFIIGVGLYRREEWARVLLVFFSGYIIVIKILIFAGLMSFNGEILTFVPTDAKNIISIAYHGFAVCFFTRGAVKKEFAA